MMCGHHHRSRSRERSHAGARPRPRADDKRASDAEREAAISDLRAHAGEGRLSVDELDERIAAALRATTRAELAKLVDDLPRRPRDRTAERREHVRSYALTMLLLVAIWAMTGADYFWPIWPIVGWGMFVLPDVVATRRGRPPHRAST